MFFESSEPSINVSSEKIQVIAKLNKYILELNSAIEELAKDPSGAEINEMVKERKSPYSGTTEEQISSSLREKFLEKKTGSTILTVINGVRIYKNVVYFKPESL